jgi:hypothetical protein
LFVSYISLFVCFTRECVNPALAVVFSFVVVPGLGNLKYSVLVFECYFEICICKKIGYFPDLGTVVCEGDPFLIVFFVCFMVRIVVLYLVLEKIYSFIREVIVVGDVNIIFHSLF